MARVQAGDLDQRLRVLELQKEEATYSWQAVGAVWAKGELDTKSNLFSSIGIGARGATFTVRVNRQLTLANAYLWRKQHCFITTILPLEDAPGYMQVKAALVTPVICTATWTPKEATDALNRPIEGTPEIVTFPGVLTEKYRGNESEDVYRTLTEQRVLVTPKAIRLRAGTVVQIPDGTDYTVRAVKDPDEWKNEYEIEHQEDV